MGNIGPLFIPNYGHTGSDSQSRIGCLSCVNDSLMQELRLETTGRPISFFTFFTSWLFLIRLSYSQVKQYIDRN